MGEIFTVLALGAAAVVFFSLGRRALDELFGWKIPRGALDSLVLRMLALLVITVCIWRFQGEEFSIFPTLARWRIQGDNLSFWTNFLVSLLAGYVLYYHFARVGREDFGWRLSMLIGLTPFLPLGMVGGVDGLALLLLAVAFVLAHRGSIWAFLPLLLAQWLDLRCFLLVPAFALLYLPAWKKALPLLTLLPLLLLQIAGGLFAGIFHVPSFTGANVLGFYIPAAITALTCALLCGWLDDDYRDLRLPAFLLLGGIAPFLFGAPFLQFALPMALATEEKRFQWGLVLLCVLNALYIGMCVVDQGVIRL